MCKKLKGGFMGTVDFWYLLFLLGLFIVINFTYKKFPKNHDNLYKILTKD
jgi:hypothetical protein